MLTKTVQITSKIHVFPGTNRVGVLMEPKYFASFVRFLDSLAKLEAEVHDLEKVSKQISMDKGMELKK